MLLYPTSGYGLIFIYEPDWHLTHRPCLLDNIHELFEKQFSLLYTTDPNMATFKKDFCAPAQGEMMILDNRHDDVAFM